MKGANHVVHLTRFLNPLISMKDHSTRLDKIVKQYEIECAHASSFLDIRKANTNVIEAINGLPGRKTITERIVKRIFQTIYE